MLAVLHDFQVLNLTLNHEELTCHLQSTIYNLQSTIYNLQSTIRNSISKFCDECLSVLTKSPPQTLTSSVLILTLVSSFSFAQAAEIANYDMTTLTISGTTSTSPNTVILAGVTVGDFTENLTGGTAAGEFGIRSSGLIPSDVNGASARSMNGSPSNPWWEFTLTPDTGKTLSFTSMTLDAGSAKTIATETDWDYALKWSVDSFVATLGTFDGPTDATATGLSVNLSSLAPQSSAVTFRLIPVRTSGTNGVTGQRAGWIDNVVLNGAITTPSTTPISASLLDFSQPTVIFSKEIKVTE